MVARVFFIHDLRLHYSVLHCKRYSCNNIPMNTTAKDIQEFALAQLDAICNFPHRSDTALYKELSEYSGLSVSYIRQFHKGERPNLTTDALDRLVDAIKKSLRKAAA